MSRKNIVKLYAFTVNQSDFNKASAQESFFFIKALNCLTDINILQKTILYASNPHFKESGQSLVKEIQPYQSFYLARLLAGHLHEVLELIKKVYKGEAEKVHNLHPVYKNGMNEDEVENFDQLNAILSSKKKILIIKTIRNKFAFHYDSKKIASSLEEIDILFPRCDSVLFVSDPAGNDWYKFADQYLVNSLIAKLGYQPEELKQALDSILNEITEVGRLAGKFLQTYAKIFLKKYSGSAAQPSEIQLRNIPSLSEVAFPFFVSED